MPKNLIYWFAFILFLFYNVLLNAKRDHNASSTPESLFGLRVKHLLQPQMETGTQRSLKGFISQECSFNKSKIQDLCRFYVNSSSTNKQSNKVIIWGQSNMSYSHATYSTRDTNNSFLKHLIPQRNITLLTLFHFDFKLLEKQTYQVLHRCRSPWLQLNEQPCWITKAL